MKLGRKSRRQLSHLATEWEAGEHVLISGGTGSGKTVLARYLDGIRLHRGGKVVVLVGKIHPDPTILEYYSQADGWVRWKTWPDKPPANVTRILLWPDVENKTPDEAKDIQKKEFKRALDEVFKLGKYVLHIDEGLFMVSPAYMNLGSVIGMLFQMLRSAGGTIIMLVQRPSHIPLTVYSNIDYAFVSRAPNADDVDRLAELDPHLDKATLKKVINKNGKHDFTMIRARGEKPPELINLAH